MEGKVFAAKKVKTCSFLTVGVDIKLQPCAGHSEIRATCAREKKCGQECFDVRCSMIRVVIYWIAPGPGLVVTLVSRISCHVRSVCHM